VNDTVEEVERRLRSVKSPAGKARNYQEYANRLNELRLNYALQEYHTNHTKLTELDSKREEPNSSWTIWPAIWPSSRTTGSEASGVDALSQSRQRYEYELVQAKAAVQSAQQRQSYAEQQLEQIAEQLATFERDRSELQTKLEAVTQSSMPKRKTFSG